MDWDESYDFVIVGSGGGSMCAALAVHSRGKRPLILEKLAKIGGTSGFSGGIMWFPDNPVSRRAGVQDSYALSRKYMDAVIGENGGRGATPLRKDAYVRESSRMVAFLESCGMRFEHSEWADYYDHLPGGLARGRSVHAPLFNIRELGDWADRLSIYERNVLPVNTPDSARMALIKRTWTAKRLALRLTWDILIDKITGKKRVGWGAAVQGRMLKLCLDAGIPVWPETPVEDFIAEDGRIVGVVAKRNGVSIRIRASDGVLINAGGFSRNQAMRDRYMRQPTSANWTSVCAGDTGEMQQAAMRLGAAVDQMEQAWWHTSSMNRDGSFPSSLRGSDGQLLPYFQSYDIAKPHGIVVDQSGQRYFNESVSYGEQVESMYQRNSTVLATPSWQIMDSRHRNQYFWGLEPPGRTPREWLESGYMKKADTLDELAQICGMDAAKLKATIARFNGFARAGIDDDFHRGENEYSKFMGDPTYSNPGLGTIEEAPFYACAMFPTDLGTCGGLVCDEHARVLREDGSSIDGLYATGNSAATVMGRTIPAAGVCVGSSFLWGWVAACHACGRPT